MQLFFYALRSPLSIARGNAAFYGWLLAYVVCALLLFGASAALAIQHQEAIEQILLDYLFPQNWQGLARQAVYFFFESQTKVALASMIISGALVTTSVFLFPLKEKCSAALERKLAPGNSQQEFPLWVQALEETKLLVLYVAVQAVVFGIGYYPYEWCKWASSVLGVAFLFYSFALDFIAPTLQRHRVAYTRIVQLLLRHFVPACVFGALFSGPLLLFGHWVLTLEGWSLIETAALLFVANIAFLALAIPAGTFMALKLKPHLQILPELKHRTRMAAYTAVSTVFVLGVSFHALVVNSLHHKSQILKCEYTLDWGSISGNFAGIKSVLFGEENAQLRFVLLIRNPTPFDVNVEDSLLVIKQNKQLVSQTKIAQIAVDSGQTVKQVVHLDAHINLGNLAGLSRLSEGWQAYLEFDLLPGIPFVLPLY